jgi:sugar porter (SP) family MFS transporter
MDLDQIAKEGNLGDVVFISAVAALGGFLFGYDTAVISGTITMVTSQFELDSILQGWYVSSALIGSIGGVLVAGYISDLIGRKKAMLISSVFFFVSAVGCALAMDMFQLVCYRICGGVGIGMISIISPMYISEIAFAKYRGAMVTLYQLAITVGFLAAYLVNFELLDFSESVGHLEGDLWNKLLVEEVWRGMLGMEAFPALIFLLMVFLLPESPRWLFFRGNEKKSEMVLGKIYNSSMKIQEEVKEMKISLGEVDKGNWKLILKPNFLKAILIGAAVAILGQFMGVNAVLYYGPTIFEQSGMSGGDALFYQVFVGGVNVLTTILALYIIDKVGRKKLVYFGVTGMIITLLLISGYFVKASDWGIPSYILLILFLAYIFFTAISISAVIFVLLSEMYPTKIRGLAMSIAGFSLWMGTFIVGQLTPWLLEVLSPQGTFVLFAVMCFPYMYIIWKLVPETTGKTLEEIERFWEE